tara:strand:+ start:136 stop:417 length:282 start_codon:yes stop_codon:yes gene_type:complete
MKFINFKTKFEIFKYFIFIVFISFLSSCSYNNLDDNKVGARFIDTNSNFTNYVGTIKLSTSYFENNSQICIYIKNDTKIIKEVSKNDDCLDEI